MITRRHLLTAAMAALWALCATSGAGAQASLPSTGSLVAAASRYVSGYREQFVFLIAEETYLQTRLPTRAKPGGQRTMRGELFLTYLAADGEWMAVHDFAEVDGAPVPDRDDLRQLLSRGTEVRGVVGRVADRNARFNIGSVTRNFNEPTLALLILEAKRVRETSFDRRSVVKDGDTTLATLEFRERPGATLVRGRRGPIRARGEVTVEASTGLVRRTVIELEEGPVKAELTTTYGHDDRLDLWVPVEFRERYESTVDGELEVVICSARYTNYRRFTGAGRIK